MLCLFTWQQWEIFLRLFEREYLLFCEDLEKIKEEDTKADDLPEKLTKSLSKRAHMLKLLSVNLYDMEENSRIERLVEFKKAYGKSVALFDEILTRAFPDKPETEIRQTLVTAFQFLHGVYPYAHATPKQIEAMKQAGVRYDKKSIYELSLLGLEKILK